MIETGRYTLIPIFKKKYLYIWYEQQKVCLQHTKLKGVIKLFETQFNSYNFTYFIHTLQCNSKVFDSLQHSRKHGSTKYIEIDLGDWNLINLVKFNEDEILMTITHGKNDASLLLIYCLCGIPQPAAATSQQRSVVFFMG